MRGQTARVKNQGQNLMGCLVGLLFLAIGFAAGFIAVGLLDETQRANYLVVTQTAVDTILTGVPADSTVATALFQSYVMYALMVLGAVWWMLTPFSVIFYTLALFPSGCALALLFSSGGPGVLCGVICVLLPGICFCLVYINAWANMTKGAKASLHCEQVWPTVKKMLLNGIWFVPCCLFQAALAPLVFKWLANVFW